MMDGKAIDDAIKTIAYHYGRKAQSLQLCEECAELVQVVSKLVRVERKDRKKKLELKLALAEEIADVRIMLEQMAFFYGISRRRVTMDIKRKVQRQLERIAEEDGNRRCHPTV